MFDIRIVNPDTGTYLHTTPEWKGLRSTRRTNNFKLACSIGVLILQWYTLQKEFP